jgi:penicillin G amidase
MRRVLKGLLALVFAVLPLVLLIAGAGLVWMSRSLPPAAGTVTVEGLSGPVTIARDGEGVPHVTAASRDDVMAGLGFAHAQDRLWQMEVSRMAAQGRLSEMFGSATLDTDVWLRTVAMYEAAAASYEGFPEDAKRAVEAYARGVNAWMAREPRFFSSRLPPEFVILGHRPEAWRPEDSVAVIKMMSVGLAANIADELTRLALARHGISPAEIDELVPPLPEIDAQPLPDINAVLELDSDGSDQAAALQPLADTDIRFGGLTGRGASNNWVVAGERTDTGSPILANDPHLGLAAPSIWYLAHLRVEEEGGARNLVGATLAGAPGVLLGRNDNVAWGFTNTGTDVQDLFIERIDPDDPGRYRTPEGHAAFETREETIRVKGGDDHRFTRRATRHGPVMPAGYGNLDRLLPDDMVGALSWTALADDDHTLVAALNLWDFETVEDFQAGMADFTAPMQSIVIGDTAGSIGLLSPGRVPIRDPENLVMGRAPVPGWDATYDWQGTVAYDELPRLLNPDEGAIGTANTRIVPDDYPHMLTMDWDEPYRQRRVDELVIDATAPHSMESSRAAQADVRSTGFADLMPKMLAAVEGRSDIDRFAVALLGDWDFAMARERAEPLIAMAWLRHAMIAIFADDLGPAFEGWLEARGKVLDDVLSGRTRRDWCDRIDTDTRESCGDVLADGLREALADLDQRYGADRNGWRWGAAHVARSEHRPFGQVAPLDRIFNVEVESGGGPFTLDRGRTALGSASDPYVNRHASSYRAIYDLANLDNSAYMTTTGQSGNVFSGHYRDFADRWSRVESIAIPAEPSRFDRQIDGVWQMVP